MKKFLIICVFCMSMPALAKCPTKAKLGDDFPAVAYKCLDGTISFEQKFRYSTSKEKKDDYESLCGAVAAANVFHAYCKNLYVDPVSIASKYFGDITPGIRPDTLKAGLNEMFENNNECMVGTWKYYYVTNRWDFLDSLYYETRSGEGYWNKAPVIVLISKDADAKILHYVTVVDILGYNPNNSDKKAYESDSCKIIYNDFGDQSEVSCKKFVGWAHQIDNQFLTSWMHEYTHLVFEPSSLNRLFHRIQNIVPRK